MIPSELIEIEIRVAENRNYHDAISNRARMLVIMSSDVSYGQDVESVDPSSIGAILRFFESAIFSNPS